MKSCIVLIFLALLGVAGYGQSFPKEQERVVMVIHGGAGTILRSQMSPEREKAYNEALTEALRQGYAILKNGGSAIDANEAAIKYMEDSPLFNAGKGAVFTNEGKNELDAAVMDGQNLKAGAVAGLTTIRNPITAARAVMEKSPHVMMIGATAEVYPALHINRLPWYLKALKFIAAVIPALLQAESIEASWVGETEGKRRKKRIS